MSINVAATITQEGIERWLRAQLGAVAFRLDNFRHGADGASGESAFFDLITDSDSGSKKQSLVLKLSPPRERIFPRDDLATQHHVMNALHARGLPTPRSLWLELDTAPLGGPFLIMEKMDGVVISDRPPGIHGAGLLFEASEAERERYWSSCIEFLARLHAVDATHPDFAFLGRPTDARTALLTKLDKLEGLLRWGEEVLPRIDDLHYALQWLREHCPTPRRHGICWDDPKLGNILFANGRLAAALDWETVDLGPGELDLAYWVFVDEASFTTNKVPRLAGLPNMAGTVALYEKFSGHKVEHFDYYLTFASCKLAIYLALAARLDKLTGAFGGRHNAADNAIINRMRARLGR
jgi:aminoglycoside phosphotransferase (APT) family kinase protein